MTRRTYYVLMCAEYFFAYQVPNHERTPRMGERLKVNPRGDLVMARVARVHAQMVEGGGEIIRLYFYVEQKNLFRFEPSVRSWKELQRSIKKRRSG